jgi:hypothetical protein
MSGLPAEGPDPGVFSQCLFRMPTTLFTHFFAERRVDHQDFLFDLPV